MPEWRIYYADGSTFDSNDGTWDDAPVDGVQAVVVRHETIGRVVFTGREFYPAVNGEPYATDTIAAFLRKYVPSLKHGLCIPLEEYDAIMQRAWRDPDFPKTNPLRRASDPQPQRRDD